MNQRAKRHPKPPQYLKEYELGKIDLTNVARAAPVVHTGRSVVPSPRQQQRDRRSLPCQVIIVKSPRKLFHTKGQDISEEIFLVFSNKNLP